MINGLGRSLQLLHLGYTYSNVSKVVSTSRNLLKCFTVPCRTTFILKRRYPVKLVKKGRTSPSSLRARNYIYDLVEDTEIIKKPDIEVILNTYVEGLGNKGDCVTVKRNKAYNELLVPGLASYATPDAVVKAKELSRTEKQFSSPHVARTMRYLSAQVLSVVMNKEVEWTLKPWHIRVAFRKAGVHVPEKAIQLPEKPIKGPDLNLEMKDFVIKVTINNTEKVDVRCRIHHWSTNLGERLPYVKYPWTQVCEPVFEEQTTQLASLPLPQLDSVKH